MTVSFIAAEQTQQTAPFDLCGWVPLRCTNTGAGACYRSSPSCTCGLSTVLVVSELPFPFNCSELDPYFTCTSCAVPVRVSELCWAQSAPDYLARNPWRLLDLSAVSRPQSIAPSWPLESTTRPFSLDLIASPLVVPRSAPTVSPPLSYQAAVADKTAKALARGKKVSAKVRLARRLPLKTPTQIKARLISLGETSATLSHSDRQLKALIKLAVLVGVNPFGARLSLVKRLVDSLNFS